MTTLTDKFCDAAAAPVNPKRAYAMYWDTEVKGFGYRKTRGSGSFVLDYRNADGVKRRHTIGTFRDPWTVRQARQEARELKRRIDRGEDPQGDRNERRAAARFDDLIEHWRVEHAPKKRERSRQQDEYLIGQWLQPEFGKRLVRELQFSDIDRLHRKIGQYGTPIRANRALSLVSKMFSLSIRWGMRLDNPARAVERFPEIPRERHLTRDELVSLNRALDVEEDRQAADIFRLLLLTGARRGELCSARWGQLSLEPRQGDPDDPPRGVWTKPATNTKQKKLHRIPLSPAAVTLFATIRERPGMTALPDAYVFPYRGTYRHDLRVPWRRVCTAAGLDGLRLHDLRHSFASILAGQGLSLPIIGRLLGHSTVVTTARYAHLLDDPLRLATNLVASAIAGAVRSQ